MPEISIIPKKQELTSLENRKSSILSYWPIVLMLVITAAVYGLFLREKMIIKKEISRNKDTFYQNEATIKQAMGVSSYELADKVSGLSQVLSSRLYWSSFLGRDNSKLLNSDMIIKDSHLDIKTLKISFSGSTSGYNSLQKQLDDLGRNKDFVQDFSLVESSFSDNSVNFKIDITFKNDILKGPFSSSL